MVTVKDLTNDVLSLSATDKVFLIDLVCKSLDNPDERIDRIWINEAEKRYEAFKNTRLSTKKWEDIKSLYE